MPEKEKETLCHHLHRVTASIHTAKALESFYWRGENSLFSFLFVSFLFSWRY